MARRLKIATPADRRNSPRLEKAISVWYRSGPQPYQRSQAADLSRSGARIAVEQPLDDGDLHLLFHLGPRLKLTLTARKVWQRGGYAGISFALPPEVETRLGKWVTRQLKQAG